MKSGLYAGFAADPAYGGGLLFGYITPCRPELRLKELDAYKAVYCGLCGQLGRSYGPVARLTLSYDFTFLAMLYWAVNTDSPRVEMRRCYINPLKRLPMCTGGEAMELGADVAAIMLYHKLRDNILDSGPLSRAGWSLLRPMASAARRKAAARRPAHDELAARCMEAQERVEREQTDSLDAAGEPTALMTSGIFRLLSEDDNKQRVLERLGYLVGRYVYLCDALDDVERDGRSGGYNPLLPRWRADRASAVEGAKRSLYMTIGEAEKTLALLELGDFAPVIWNIVSMGLRAKVDEICAEKEKAK